jgi:hypothetical protein
MTWHWTIFAALVLAARRRRLAACRCARPVHRRKVLEARLDLECVIMRGDFSSNKTETHRRLQAEPLTLSRFEQPTNSEAVVSTPALTDSICPKVRASAP